MRHIDRRGNDNSRWSGDERGEDGGGGQWRCWQWRWWKK